jgi:hypothetical protein
MPARSPPPRGSGLAVRRAGCAFGCSPTRTLSTGTAGVRKPSKNETTGISPPGGSAGGELVGTDCVAPARRCCTDTTNVNTEAGPHAAGSWFMANRADLEPRSAARSPASWGEEGPRPLLPTGIQSGHSIGGENLYSILTPKPI